MVEVTVPCAGEQVRAVSVVIHHVVIVVQDGLSVRIIQGILLVKELHASRKVMISKFNKKRTLSTR